MKLGSATVALAAAALVAMPIAAQAGTAASSSVPHVSSSIASGARASGKVAKKSGMTPALLAAVAVGTASLAAATAGVITFAKNAQPVGDPVTSSPGA